MVADEATLRASDYRTHTVSCPKQRESIASLQLQQLKRSRPPCSQKHHLGRHTHVSNREAPTPVTTVLLNGRENRQYQSN